MDQPIRPIIEKLKNIKELTVVEKTFIVRAIMVSYFYEDLINISLSA